MPSATLVTVEGSPGLAKILLVDDDAQLSRQIKAWLGYDAHQMELAADTTNGLKRLNSQTFDLIILDWMLPDGSGLDLCRHYRSSGGQAPIIMLSARQAIDDKALALDAGADDYLGKPFHPKELSARLNALLRRPGRLKPTILKAGALELDTAAHKVFINGQELAIPPRELALLQFFMENPNRNFTADEIVDMLWSAESEVSPSVVKVYVNKLRKRLADCETRSTLRTTRGAGYLFAPENAD